MNDEDVEFPTGVSIPLNSKKLTTKRLQAIAAGLELPASATTEDLRLLIEGKITDRGQNPSNIQVTIADEDSSTLHLVDENGCFLTVTVPEEIGNATECSPPASDGEDDDRQQVARLRAKLI